MIKSLVYFLGSDDYKKRIRQFFQFCVVGGLGAVVNISLLYFLTEHGFHFHYILSGAISIEIAFVFNFLLNRVWTFNHIDICGFNEIIRALIRDHAVRSVGMGINLFLFILTDIVGIFYILSQLIGAGVAVIWNFAGNLRWIWAA